MTIKRPSQLLKEVTILFDLLLSLRPFALLGCSDLVHGLVPALTDPKEKPASLLVFSFYRQKTEPWRRRGPFFPRASL
jgi:hypothetical protein